LIDEIHGLYLYASLAVIPTTKWFGIPNHFESSIYSREKVWALPNLFGSGIGMEIAEAVFQITEQLPKKEDYGLTSQLRRAALSMSSNVAEGFGRSGKKDKSKFYEYVRSSGFEVRNDLIYGVRVGYFAPDKQGDICKNIHQFTHEINKLMFSLNK